MDAATRRTRPSKSSTSLTSGAFLVFDIKVAPLLNSLRSDPRYTALLDPENGFRSALVHEEGDKLRARSKTFADHYSQAHQFVL